MSDPVDQPNEKSKKRRIDVRRLREGMGLSQSRFAWIFGFPVATLRHWERGNRVPTGSALVLLHVISEHPAVVRQAVIKARAQNPGSFGKRQPRKSHRAPPDFSTTIDSWSVEPFDAT